LADVQDGSDPEKFLYEIHREKLMRYCIGVYEVAGYFNGLAQGLRSNGFVADFYLDTPTEFNYKCDANRFNAIFLVLRGRVGVLKNTPIIFIARLLTRLCLFVYCLFKYDVFIFSGFGSFFNFLELPILRFFNKKVVVIYLGSDGRPAMFSGGFVDLPQLNNSPIENVKRVRRQIRLIRRVERAQCIIVNHTASAELFTRKFVPFLHVGIPMDLNRRLDYLKNTGNSGEIAKDAKTVKVVHAPSRPLSKGSPALIAEFLTIQAKAKSRGIDVELVSLMGVSNETVLREIQNADLVLNELYSDTYMSVLDAEAALFGKPSLKFGYYASNIISDNPHARHPSKVLFWSPDELGKILEQYIYNIDLRVSSGQSQADFLENCWNAKSVAARLNQLVFDPQLLNSILVSPNSFSYHLGWGLTKSTWLSQVNPCLELTEFESLFSRQHFEQITANCDLLKKEQRGMNELA
jgi:hypothetical protein